MRGVTARRMPLVWSDCPILTGAPRVGFWWSARLVKGAARVWVCLRRGAAVSGSARQAARKQRRLRQLWLPCVAWAHTAKWAVCAAAFAGS